MQSKSKQADPIDQLLVNSVEFRCFCKHKRLRILDGAWRKENSATITEQVRGGLEDTKEITRQGRLQPRYLFIQQ